MSDSDDFELPYDDKSRGDGAGRVPLSHTITAVLHVLDECAADLEAVRHYLRQEDVPESLEVDESLLAHPPEQVRRIAVNLEMCASELRDASGKGEDPSGMDREEG
jgi:hypothetical protein